MRESALAPARPAPPAGHLGAHRVLPATTVLGLFEGHAARTPEAPALTCGDEQLTYAGLNEAAELLADRLRSRGVGPGRRVAVHLERSADLVVGLLAIWKTGGVHLPVDPALPSGRVDFLLDDSNAELLLTAEESADPREMNGRALVLLDGPARLRGDGAGEPRAGARAEAGADGDAPAYVIYTSGSTGRPKGVRVGHRALLNVVLELAKEMPCGPGDRWLAVAAAGFDISMAELSVPLATGAELVLATDGQLRDPRALVRLVRERGITRMQAVPSQWRLLLDAGFHAPGLVAMVGGESLTVNLARELRARVAALFNGYGPTETTVLSTLWRVPEQVVDISIGGPIANTRLYLLDEDRVPVGPGLAGELCIAGAGVALGYANRPELTAERFVPEPGRPDGSVMYRTGDRCRWRADGLLEFIGRADGQVKIRGRRIELGEVEAGLGAMPGVAGVAVAVHEQGAGGPALVAYLVADAGAPSPTAAEVREFGRTVLPSSMVPSLVVVLDRFPLTANGKVDRRALPDPAAPGGTAVPLAAVPSAAGSGTPADPPEPAPRPQPGRGPSGLLAEVCEICREVLGVERVLPGDDLADLGGHSLSMMQIAGLMHTRWNVDIPVELFFDHDTVAEIAEAIGRIRAGS
ncbi:amino acid adenylation domain-containing protein [Kitasatospora sp. NBC_00315]|uniref:non-ribosomal peptide synthetase n=1 Tax=Kitasatospora sp. NBC_00315 TaxID=2975963 RepID=UPI0032500044